MNTEEPHDIRRFHDGEEIPYGYVEITEEEFEKLDKMDVAERGEWLRANKERTPMGGFADELHSCDPERDASIDLARTLRRDQEDFQRKHGAKVQGKGPAPPITPRQHRSQGR